MSSCWETTCTWCSAVTCWTSWISASNRPCWPTSWRTWLSGSERAGRTGFSIASFTDSRPTPWSARRSAAVDETARRLRLHTEVFADAVASALVDDDNDVIATIVKVHSGLRTVDPAAYVRQAHQILEADPTSSRGWTHPELHVRVAALAARRAPRTDEIVRTLIEGPDELDRLDMLGQLRLETLSGRALAAGRRAAAATANVTGVEIEQLDTHIASFPAGVQRAASTSAAPLEDEAFAASDPSVRHLCGALLVDLALVTDGVATDLSIIAPIAIEAERVGVADEFDKILCRATNRTARDLRVVRQAAEPR